MKSDVEIQAIVADVMADMAMEVEPLTYSESYDLTDEEVDRAIELQWKARLNISFLE